MNSALHILCIFTIRHNSGTFARVPESVIDDRHRAAAATHIFVRHPTEPSTHERTPHRSRWIRSCGSVQVKQRYERQTHTHTLTLCVRRCCTKWQMTSARLSFIFIFYTTSICGGSIDMKMTLATIVWQLQHWTTSGSAALAWQPFAHPPSRTGSQWSTQTSKRKQKKRMKGKQTMNKKNVRINGENTYFSILFMFVFLRFCHSS